MRYTFFTAVLGLGSTAYAASAVNKQCPNSNICYSINIPDSTSSSGSGDVFLQITGPSSNGWVGMGTGSQMSGASMFIIYASSNGNNVTLSPRKATGHIMPTSSSAVQGTLLEGSGITNGIMTANIRCSSCSPSQANWIYAAGPGVAINSDSQSATISQHQNTYGTFSFSLASAKGGSDANPFVAAGSTTGSSGSGSGSSGSGSTGSGSTGSGSTGSGSSGSGSSGSGSSGSGSSGSGTSGSACNRAATAGSSAGGSSSTGSASSGTSGGSGNGPPGTFPFGSRPTGIGSYNPFQGGNKKRATNDGCDDGPSTQSQNGASGAYSLQQIKLIAHGILAGLTFSVLFPFGAIAIRLFSFPGLIWFHAIWQIIAQIMFIAAFALGVTIAQELNLMTNAHPIIGIVLFILLLIQPFLGYMHHAAFKRTQTRTAWSHGHIWLGRIIITLGIINGGLGFLLAANTSYGPIAYGVVAGVFWLAYVAASFIGERRRKRGLPPKYEETPHGSGTATPRVEYYGQNTRR